MEYTYKCKCGYRIETQILTITPNCSCGQKMTRDYSAINIINPNGRENPVKVKSK